MLKFRATGKNGLFVGLGMSFENLRRIRGGEPIQFYQTELELGEGIFVICHAADPQLVIFRSLPKEVIGALVVLSDAELDQLQRGELLLRDAEALGLDEQGDVALMAAQSESDLLDAFRAVGLVTDETTIDTPDGVVQSNVTDEDIGLVNSTHRGNFVELAKYLVGGLICAAITIFVLTTLISGHFDGLAVGIVSIVIFGASAVILLGVAARLATTKLELGDRGLRLCRGRERLNIRFDQIHRIRTEQVQRPVPFSSQTGAHTRAVILCLADGSEARLADELTGWDTIAKELSYRLGVAPLPVV